MFGPRHPDDYLIPSERRVIRVRRHWAFLLWDLLTTVGILVGVFVVYGLSVRAFGQLWLLDSILWYVAVFAVLRCGWKVLEWWIELVVVTDKRFMIANGILAPKLSMMPISKVTDMSYLRTPGGQLLGYGTLRVESAGQKQDLEKVDFLPRPEEVFDTVSELIFGEKQQGRTHMLPPAGRKRA
ncbi:MAG TPA: PH domain-containing protein [Pseudonocardiaceae bacterium]